MKKIKIVLFSFSILFIVWGQNRLLAQSKLNTVKIGTQEWTTINLSTENFRNGDIIPEAKSDEDWYQAYANGKPAWCYYENDTSNGRKYGKLYNWYAVNDTRGLAPIGFHIPMVLEWAMLSDYLGGDTTSGSKLKTINGWEEIDITSNTNSSGFSAVPGGKRTWNSDIKKYEFTSLTQGSFFWSSTHSTDKKAYFSALVFFGPTMLNGPEANYSNGFSVRCIKDGN